MTIESSPSLWERQAVLQAAKQTLAEDIASQQVVLRSGDTDQTASYSLHDIVIALHGKKAVADPTILGAWQGLAGRFEGAEGLPFLVVERNVGQASQGYNMRPAYWLGTVPEQPIGYLGEDETILRSMGSFTVASALSYKPYKPGFARGVPRLSYGEYRDQPVDTVVAYLDKPIRNHYRIVDTDFRPYFDLLCNWTSARRRYHHPEEYPTPNPLHDMSLLEVVVGTSAIKAWVAASPTKLEQEIVKKAFKHQMKQNAS